MNVMLSVLPACERPQMSDGELKLELLLDLGAMIGREVELDELLRVFGRRVAHALDADRATLWLVDADTDQLISRVANLPELDELAIPIGHGVAGYVAESGQLVNIRDAVADERWAPDIVERDGPLRGVLQVLNSRRDVFDERDEEYARALAGQIALAFEYTSLRGADTPRGVPVRGRFNHIVGSSAEMATVYDLVVRAAGTDATVLLHGETGTGKGVFARAIHVNSERRDGPLVTVDCTNLPASLVESELFGHERGAYTGADSRVVGKVELAAGGTLFLDEIGEVPLELQSKLLRFLQDRHFERVGGRETLSSDARIVVSTNRDLHAMVQEGSFRSDLFYRIRVLEIELPPLRKRGAEEILLLAQHFLTLFRGKYRKPPLRLSESAREALSNHRWPGNVRELEHAIERAVVMSDGDLLDVDTFGLLPSRAIPDQPTADSSSAPHALPDGLSLEELERRYARETVTRCDGNRSAAARQLGIGRNRLARLLKE